MSLQRWGTAFLQLGALLAAIGLLPALVMALFFPHGPSAVPVLLSLSVAPLGLVCLATGGLMWLVALLRRRGG